MITKQCKFKETPEDNWRGGILIETNNENDNFIICGCCGCIMRKQEIAFLEEFEIFKTWIDINKEIIGE